MTTTNPPARVALALLALGLVWTLGARAADGAPPTERFVRLELAGSVLTLDRDAGYALSSWIDYSGLARQLLVPGKSGLVGLGFTRAGDTSGELWRVASTQAESSTCELRTDATGTTARINFNRLGGKDINALCTVSVRGGLVAFRVEVTGREALVLEEVQCPVIEVAAPLGRSLDDDAAVFGDSIGGLHRLRLWLRTQAADAATEQVNLTAYDQPPDTDYHLWTSLGRWVIQLPPSAEWQERSVEFTVPAGAQTVDLMLRGQPGGTAWFDDLILEERSADGTWGEVRQAESGAMALLRQWVPLLCAAESRPFLLHGRMLRPPPLRTETTSFCYSRRLADPQPKIMVQAYNDLLSPQGAWDASLPADASDWRRLEIGFSLPPGATQLHLFLPLDVQGTFWFDDVRLEQAGAPGNRLANGSFEAWPPAAAMPDGWTFWSRDASRRAADVVSRESTGVHDGQNALRLTFATPTPGVQFKQQIDIQAAGIRPDHPCTLSLWVRSTGAVRADSEKLTRTAPAVLHNRFQAPDGREALVLANVTAAPRLATVEWRGKEMPISLRPWEARLELLP